MLNLDDKAFSTGVQAFWCWMIDATNVSVNLGYDRCSSLRRGAPYFKTLLNQKLHPLVDGNSKVNSLWPSDIYERDARNSMEYVLCCWWRLIKSKLMSPTFSIDCSLTKSVEHAKLRQSQWVEERRILAFGDARFLISHSLTILHGTFRCCLWTRRISEVDTCWKILHGICRCCLWKSTFEVHIHWQIHHEMCYWCLWWRAHVFASDYFVDRQNCCNLIRSLSLLHTSWLQKDFESEKCAMVDLTKEEKRFSLTIKKKYRKKHVDIRNFMQLVIKKKAWEDESDSL